jgi:ABC-2 type transport system ATP-binding protein
MAPVILSFESNVNQADDTSHKRRQAETTLGIDVSNLRKKYGELLAVNDISFHVRPGEILGLIGPNGAGKSTSIMMMTGALKPDSGMVRLNGQIFDPSNAQMRSQWGIVPQELAIYPQMTAVQNLRFFGRLYGLQGRRLENRVENALQATGLTESADRKPSTFSGGMQRRLNFGVALLHEPRFVVLDEPTVGVDPQSRSNLLDCVKELSARGVCVVYTSHNMDEIQSICDRVAIVDHGRILASGTLDELLDRNSLEFSIKSGPLPPSLQVKLRETATVNHSEDGTSLILIRDRQASGHRTGAIQLRSVLGLLQAHNVPLLAIETHETSLETVFLKLTGRKLRD